VPPSFFPSFNPFARRHEGIPLSLVFQESLPYVPLIPFWSRPCRFPPLSAASRASLSTKRAPLFSRHFLYSQEFTGPSVFLRTGPPFPGGERMNPYPLTIAISSFWQRSTAFFPQVSYLRSNDFRDERRDFLFLASCFLCSLPRRGVPPNFGPFFPLIEAFFHGSARGSPPLHRTSFVPSFLEKATRR